LGRYHAHREAEVAQGNMPDIVVSSTSGNLEVAVEVKHGGRDWTVTELETALRLQLGEDYLKPSYRRHGILVITNHRNRFWLHPKTGKRLAFLQMIEYLQGIAKRTKKNSLGAIALTVLGIDASPLKRARQRASKAPRRTRFKRRSR
jgi:hypothetical protein